MPPDQSGFLRRAHRFLIYFGGLYSCFLVLITIPYFQHQLIFLHKLKWPLNADFARPEKYGLAPQRALNLNITTEDGVSLGAWFIFAEPFYASSYISPLSGNSSSLTPSSAIVSSAMGQYPTVLYFHGNGASRAVAFRVAAYKSLTTRLGANVLVLDYRGFADSEGTPTENGLRQDARAAWQWSIEHGARPEDIVIAGQSLGTGVASQLALDLARKDTRPKGLVLIAPFSSIPKLLETYNLLGWIPFLKPLQSIPYAQGFMLRFLKIKFDTKRALRSVNTDVILIHAEDDFDISSSHSLELFDTLLDPLLPPAGLTQEDIKEIGSISQERWSEIRAQEEKRLRVRNEIVQTDSVEGLGRISQFTRTKDGPRVVFIESKWGGHNQLLFSEGVVDAVGHVLEIRRLC